MSYTPPAGNAVDLNLVKPLPATNNLTLTGPVVWVAPAHDAVDLTLSAALPANADLAIGGDVTDPSVPDATATIAGRFVLGGAGAVVQQFEAVAAGRFALRGSASVAYDNSVFRGVVAQAIAPFDEANAQRSDHSAGWQPATPLPTVKHLLFDPAQAVPVDEVAAWAQATKQHAQKITVFDLIAQNTQQSADTGWGYAAPTRRQTATVWGLNAAPAGHSAAVESNQAAATHQQHRNQWGTAAAPRHRSNVTGFNRLARHTRDTRIAPWQQGRHLSSQGGPWPPSVPVVPPEPVSTLLRLCRRLPVSTTLIFGADQCSGELPANILRILPARFYMAVHSIACYLLPGSTSLPIYDVSLSADNGSFGWTFSASGPASIFDALAPTGTVPASVRVEIDGIDWVFVVDSIQRQKEFGKSAVRFGGRSATALIGQPYARETLRNNASALNAQQLATAALDLSGVGLDWGITDWLVPAGVWSHQGTPLAAVQAIAEAAGGFVNSHRSAATLLVRHPYPTLPGGVPGGPWNWESATSVDVELAPDALITTSIERRDGPDIDAVYVSGTNAGVLALVKRTGTAGAKLAGLITDPLITHADAAQQRGLSVLGKAGGKHLVQITLPVLTGVGQPGVLDVNQLIQVNDVYPWRGRVRSVSVNAAMPSVRQAITLERHL